MAAFDYKNQILLYDDTGSSHVTVAMYEKWAGESNKDKITNNRGQTTIS